MRARKSPESFTKPALLAVNTQMEASLLNITGDAQPRPFYEILDKSYLRVRIMGMKILIFLFLIFSGFAVALDLDDPVVQACKIEVNEIYPDTQVGNSPLSKAVVAEIRRLKQEKSEVFKDPKWPMKVATICAAKLGIQPKLVAGNTRASESNQPNDIEPTPVSINQHMPPEEMGHVMDNVDQKAHTLRKREMVAMQKIAALGIYAISTRDFNQPVKIIDDVGSINTWELKSGQAFPFLGVSDGQVRLMFADTWISVPLESVKLARLSEHPELEANHLDLLASYQANKQFESNISAIAASLTRMSERSNQQSQQIQNENQNLQNENLQLRLEQSKMRHQEYQRKYGF